MPESGKAYHIALRILTAPEPVYEHQHAAGTEDASTYAVATVLPM
jgi:hypothetical protein